MASTEHKKIADTIKGIHQELRNLSQKIGAENAWKQLLQDKAKLNLYSQSMRELSENYWKLKNDCEKTCRIRWTINFCETYFQHDELERWRLKDMEIIKKINEENGSKLTVSDITTTIEPGTVKVLDVGSSGNFFSSHDRFEILPIDIAPSNESVYYCDFLAVPIGDCLKISEDHCISQLCELHYNLVIFCLLLEYLPSSDQRIKCVMKCLQVLQYGGLLVIITPDSCHQNVNAKLMKNWRWTLATVGFQRIKIEKLENLTCMAFRKSLDPSIPQRWAQRYKEPYMSFMLEIPQDRKKKINADDHEHNIVEFDTDLMNELPFQ